MTFPLLSVCPLRGIYIMVDTTEASGPAMKNRLFVRPPRISRVTTIHASVYLLKENLELEDTRSPVLTMARRRLHQVRAHPVNTDYPWTLICRSPTAFKRTSACFCGNGQNSLFIFVSGDLPGDVYPTVAMDPRAAHVKKPQIWTVLTASLGTFSSATLPITSTSCQTGL